MTVVRISYGVFEPEVAADVVRVVEEGEPTLRRALGVRFQPITNHQCAWEIESPE